MVQLSPPSQYAIVALIRDISVAIAERPHPFPSRTRKLSSPAPMVLHGRLCGRVGAAGILIHGPLPSRKGLFLFYIGERLVVCEPNGFSSKKLIRETTYHVRTFKMEHHQKKKGRHRFETRQDIYKADQRNHACSEARRRRSRGERPSAVGR